MLDIHQMWLNKDEYDNTEPPEQYQTFCETWKQSEFRYRFWNRHRIDLLFELHPNIQKYRDFYLALTNKYHFARYLVLAIYGGIFVDLNIERTASITDKIQPDCIHFLFHSMNLNEKWLTRALKTNLRTVANTFIISTPSPKHSEFWFALLDHVMADHDSMPEPVMLTRFIEQPKWRDEISFVYIVANNSRFFEHCIVHHDSSNWKVKQFFQMVYWAMELFRDVKIVIAIFGILLCNQFW